MFNIIISIIRAKIIAVLLGPTGMGLAGLLTSTTGLISSLTNFGIGTSAVRDVAAAYEKGNNIRIATVMLVLRRVVWITGCLGALVTLCLSPWLSQFTFGNKDYTLAFVWLSITLLLSQLSSGQMVMLQGMRKLKHLARANIYGSALGLIITIPIYYKFRMQGIVPSIIIYSIVSLTISWYFSRMFKTEKVKVSPMRTFAEGKKMLVLGFMLSLSGLISFGTSYLVKIYISKTGGIDQVGLYNSGFTIIFTYVGMIFAAMATDYYPRLSAVMNDNLECRRIINQQADVAILIIAPILSIFLVFINVVILLLYTKKFLVINEMIHWVALGMFFKASSWAIAFLLLAKGSTRIYFWSEVVAILYMFAFNIVGYRYGGLTGVGFSYLLGYFIYFFQNLIISRIKFEFRFDSAFYWIFIVQFLLSLICFTLSRFLSGTLFYIIGSIVILVSTTFSLFELNKRIGLFSFLQNMIKKNYR